MRVTHTPLIPAPWPACLWCGRAAVPVLGVVLPTCDCGGDNAAATAEALKRINALQKREK